MKNILLLLTIILSTVLWAQTSSELTQTIRGTVIDKVSQTPLPGASIIIEGTSPIIGTTSNFNGEFKLENIPVGRINLQVSFLGYNSANLRNLLLVSGKELVLNIELEEQAFITDELVVKARKRKDEVINEMATVSARSFTVEETERYAGSLGDPSRMASNFAGVSMINDSRNDIIIRGNSPTGLLWRIDGIEVPNPNHFGAMGTTGGPVSIINNNLLTNSDFFTSAFPAEYGNAMSGVFDLRMRSGNNQKREYVAQVGFNGFEVGAEGPFSKKSKASYIVNYRYSALDIMHAMGIDFGTGKAIPQYQDLTFKINLPTKKMGRFTILGIGGLSYIELNDSEKEANSKDQSYVGSGADLDFGSDMGVLGLSHLYFFDENTRLNTYVSVQGSRARTAIDSLGFDANGHYIPNSNYKYYDSKNSEIKYSVSTHLKHKFSAKNNAKAGVYYELYSVSYIDSAKVTEPNFSGFQKNFDTQGSIPILRAYVQWQHKFSNTLTLNSGLYSQYVHLSKEATLEPRIGLKYAFAKKQSLSIGYGLHSQMQPRIFYFIQTHLPDGSYIESNRNMKLSKSHQLVIGYDYLLGENFHFKTEAYYQYLFDIPVSESNPDYSVINTGTDFGSFYPDSLVNLGTGINYGLEFTIEKFLSKNFYFLATTSLFQSKYRGYNDVERNTAFNNNYIFNLLGGYEIKISRNGSIYIDIKGVYSGGQRYVPIDLEKSKQSNTTEYDWSKAYERRHDDYFRLDTRLSYKLNGKKISQEWAIDLQNVTNHQNLYSESYNPRTQSLSSDYQTGFFPMFLYRIHF